MTISQNNFEAIRSAYAPIFDALERAFAALEIDFYLIGAQSRDVWTNHLPLVKRTTRDIDFAVMISNRAMWNELIQYLTKLENFSQDPDQPYRFYLEGRILDLIPFGGMEENGEVILENPRTELSVYGCREVTADAEIILGKYKVITLAGLCIMKLIAYDEKSDWRAKDFDDFELVMKNYGEIAGEALYSRAFEDLIKADFELPVAAARMLGRQMQTTLNKNERLKKRIASMLDGKLQGFSKEEIDQMFEVNDKDDPIILRLKLISEVIHGIGDQLS